MTTAAQAKRIVALDDALQGLASLKEAMTPREPEGNHAMVVFYLSIEDSDGQGSGSVRDGFELSLDAADVVMPLFEQAIKDELRKLGAEP